jgi:hypothetical protein
LQVDGFVTGNAALDGAAQRGWFVGAFMPDAHRRRADIELKWGVHPRGESEGQGWVANRTGTTVSILIEGAFVLRLRSGGEVAEIRLAERGDYAMWEPGVEHCWEALEDSVVLSIRCPSVPDDQIARPL